MPEITRRAPYVVNLLCIAIAAAVVFLPLNSSASEQEGCEGTECVTPENAAVFESAGAVDGTATELVGRPPVPDGPTAADDVALAAVAAPQDVTAALPTIEDDGGVGGVGDDGIAIDRVQVVLLVCAFAALGAAAFGRRPSPHHATHA